MMLRNSSRMLPTEKRLCITRRKLRSLPSSRTFLRILPGTYSTEPFIHDHWEEVYLCEGDLIVGNDINGEGGEKFYAPTYACRPPGAYHGPFKSDEGCVMFELHYYYKPDKG